MNVGYMEYNIMRELNVSEIKEVNGGNWIINSMIYDAGKWLLSQKDWGTASYADMMVAP
jgi:hypothetical protein